MVQDQKMLWRGLKIRLNSHNIEEAILSRRLVVCDHVVLRYLPGFSQEAWQDFIEQIKSNQLSIKTLEVNDDGNQAQWPVSLIPALKNIEEVILWGDIDDSVKTNLLETIVDADRSSLKLRRLSLTDKSLNMDEKLLAKAAMRLETLDGHWILSSLQVRKFCLLPCNLYSFS